MAIPSTGRTHRAYGWRPSLPDPRDVQADTSEIPVLAEVDPRGTSMTEIYDQGRLGSCTANAVAAAIDADRITRGMDPIRPARLAIYWFERFLEGQPADTDQGAFGRDGFKGARRYGVLPEADWPYSDDSHSPEFAGDPRQAPGWPADHQLLDHQYKTVRRSLLDFKRVLSNQQTIAFGFVVPTSFESDTMTRTGILGDPDPEERTSQGHEVLAVGYLASEPHYFLARNSWGTGWGMAGYFLMPWTWLLDRSWTSDLRTIYRPLS